jgi:hypothetical protein
MDHQMVNPHPEENNGVPEKVRAKLNKRAREMAVVFLLGLLVFSTLAFWTSRHLRIFSADALNLAYLAKTLGFGRFPLTSDSRLFLLPMPVILQIPLMAIPGLWPDVSAGIIISIISASFLGALLFDFAKSYGFPAILRWLLWIIFIANPFILVEAVNGTSVIFMMCLFFLLLSIAFRWLENRHWLMLLNLGLSSALAIMTRFNSLVFIIIPLVIVGINALWEKPDQPAYAENAIWIIATPVVYVILARFFFISALSGSALFFENFDKHISFSIELPSAASGLNNLQYLNHSFATFISQISYVFPLTFLILVLLILVSAVKSHWNNILLLALCCLPVALAYTNTFSPVNRYLLFIIPSGYFLLVAALNLVGRGRVIVTTLGVLLLLASNVYSAMVITKNTFPSEQRTFLSSWLHGNPQENFSDANEMAIFIDQHSLEPILTLDQTAGPVVAFSSFPAHFITPLNADFLAILSNLKNFQGYLLLSSTQPLELTKVFPGLTESSSVAIESQVGGWYLISLSPEFSR